LARAEQPVDSTDQRELGRSAGTDPERHVAIAPDPPHDRAAIEEVWPIMLGSVRRRRRRRCIGIVGACARRSFGVVPAALQEARRCPNRVPLSADHAHVFDTPRLRRSAPRNGTACITRGSPELVGPARNLAEAATVVKYFELQSWWE